MKDPTTEQFTAALAKLKTPSDRFLKMLRTHYSATNRTSTARELSRKAGYANYRGFNVRYGIFARDLGKAMGVKSSKGVGLLVDFASPGDLSNREYLIFMKEPFAKALKKAGWV